MVHIISADHERPDGRFGGVIVDGQVTPLGIPYQPGPDIVQIAQRFAQFALWRYHGQRVIQPGAQFLQHRQAAGLPGLEALGVSGLFEPG